MTLITCKDCKKELSSDTKICPNCGAKAKSSNISFICFLLLIVLITSLYSVGNKINNTSKDISSAEKVIEKRRLSMKPEYIASLDKMQECFREKKELISDNLEIWLNNIEKPALCKEEIENWIYYVELKEVFKMIIVTLNNHLKYTL